VIFDPDTGKMSAIPEQAEEILSLCDGKHNVKEIALSLARKYDARAEQIEGDVLALLLPLVRSGYIAA
jgi:hypothetical protein